MGGVKVPVPEFALLLRRYRERRGLSQNSLGRAVELSASMINMLERDERRPTREMIRRIARALELSTTETDEFLLAGGQLPLVYDTVSPADPDLLSIAGILGNLALPERERNQLRLLIRLITLRWRGDDLDVTPCLTALGGVVGAPVSGAQSSD